MPVGPGFPLRPRPPKYPPRVAAQQNVTPQYARAVIAMVDDPTSPTVATVYIANSLPAEDGYKIPSSIGVKFMQAPAAWNSATAYQPGQYAFSNGAAYKCIIANTNSQPPNSNWVVPSGVAFYNDPTTLEGGSWCSVDTVNKVIAAIEQGESNAPPSNPSDLFQYIRHDGAYNTSGQFENPGPIDTTQLLTGALDITPVISSTGTLTKSAQSTSGTTDFTGTFTLNSVGTTATGWLKKVYLVASIAGQNKWGIYGWVTPNANGTYTGTWAGIGSGKTNYDLGVVYEGINHELSNVGIVWSNQAPNTILVATPAGASVGFSGTPTIVSWDAGKPGSNPTLMSPTAQVQFTLSESTNPDTSEWVYQVIGYVRQTGQTQWQSYPQVPGYGTGFTNGNLVSILYGPITPGYNYDFAFLMADINGNLSNGGTPVVLLSNVAIANAQVPNTQLQTMPSTTKTNGPTISSASYTARGIARGVRQIIKVTFTETDFTSLPGWIDAIWIQTRINGTTTPGDNRRIDPSSSTNGTYSSTPIFCAAGDVVDIGIFYTDQKGQQSTVVWPTALQGITDPNGDLFNTSDPNGAITFNRHAAPVRGTLNPSADAFGAYTKAGVLHRLHLDVAGQPGGTNLAFNPTGAAGFNGWTRTGTPQVFTWYTDTFGGGRFGVGGSASLVNSGYDGWMQSISVFANQDMVVSGILESDNALPAGVAVWCDVLNSAQNSVLGGFEVTSADGVSIRLTRAAKFNTGSNTTVYLRFYIYNTSGATQTLSGFTFSKLQLEYGTQPSPWVDHLSNTLVNHTHTVNGQLDLSVAQQTLVASSAGSDGSALLNSVVGNRHVMSTSVAGTQVLPAVYSTQQVNTATNSADWADLNGNDIQQNSTPLGNGSTYQYNTGSSAYQGNATPRGATYVLPASGSATFKFIHNAFASGGNGKPRIAFTGTVSGGSLAQQTSPVSGSQQVSWANAPRTKIIGGEPVTTDYYSQSSGTAQQYTVTTTVDPATDAINLNLNSVSCPSDANGYSDITITLVGPGGTVIDGSHLTLSGSGTLTASGNSASVIGVSAATTISYHPASGSQGTGQYTWTIQAIAHNDDSSGQTYNGTYTVSFSGTASYWQNSSSAQTYVLASDGVTQRTSVLDSDVQLTQVGPGQFAVTVHNSSTTSALSFSLGMDVSGV